MTVKLYYSSTQNSSRTLLFGLFPKTLMEIGVGGYILGRTAEKMKGAE